MKAILLVLAGCLIGAVLVLGTLYLGVIVLCAAFRMNMIKMQESMQESAPKIEALQKLIERKRKEGLKPENFQDDGELQALQAEIQGTFNPYNLVPKFLMVFMPKEWKDAQKHSELITYINQAIPSIIKDWRVEELFSRCTPKFLGLIQRNDLEQSFDDFLKRFGRLQMYKGLKYCSLDDSIPGRKPARWNFVVEAAFELRSATITGQVILKGNQFLIDNFYISDAHQL